MPAIVINCLLLIGGLGTFLVGMRLLQTASEKLAAGPLKRMFAKTADHRWLGAGIGCAGTCIIQSSSAMTVMIVGFVNSGVMTLIQAAAYIIGANIGTTITAQIVALSNLPISEFIIALIFVGAILVMIFKKDHFQTIGNFVCGLGMLFLGIFVMKENLDSIFAENSFIGTWLTTMTNPFVLLLIGAGLTALFQSSSAVTSVLIALALAGVVVGGNGNGIFYVILGTNIGSCATAVISGIGSSANGKRAAVIHLLFNCFGSVLFFVILICWPSFNEMTFQRLFSSPATQIAMFHTFFNLVCALIFLPAVKLLVKIATFIVKDKVVIEEKLVVDDEKSLLDRRILNGPELALNQSYRYYRLMAERSMKTLNVAIDALIKKDSSLHKIILNEEQIVTEMAKKLVDYLVLISGEDLTEAGKKRISTLQLNLADIVRLSEIADNIAGYTDKLVESEMKFSVNVIPELLIMQEKLNSAYGLAMSLDERPNDIQGQQAVDAEDTIDNLRSTLIREHLERLNKGLCEPALSGLFINLVGNLERAGDHLYFISQRAIEYLPK